MPFNFFKPGPSVTLANDCEFVMATDFGQPAVKNSAGVWPLERGDWMLEYVLNRQNLIGVGLFGILLLAISYARMRDRITAAEA